MGKRLGGTLGNSCGWYREQLSWKGHVQAFKNTCPFPHQSITKVSEESEMGNGEINPTGDLDQHKCYGVNYSVELLLIKLCFKMNF